MSRTTINIDDDKCEAARRELGTKNKTETVDAALTYFAERGQRARKKLSALDFWGEDIGDEEIMKQARR